jgi:hypothetical protein
MKPLVWQVMRALSGPPLAAENDDPAQFDQSRHETLRHLQEKELIPAALVVSRALPRSIATLRHLQERGLIPAALVFHLPPPLSNAILLYRLRDACELRDFQPNQIQLLVRQVMRALLEPPLAAENDDPARLDQSRHETLRHLQERGLVLEALAFHLLPPLPNSVQLCRPKSACELPYFQPHQIQLLVRQMMPALLESPWAAENDGRPQPDQSRHETLRHLQERGLAIRR